MASRKPSPDQQSFMPAVESAASERYAMLLSALRAIGASGQVRSVVLLVYNMTKGANPTLDWTAEQYAEEFALATVRTARRWLNKAVDSGLLTKRERRYESRGGQKSNQVSIDWEGVRAIACGPERTGAIPQKTSRPKTEAKTGSKPLVNKNVHPGCQKCHPGVSEMSTRVDKIDHPYKEYQSSKQSLKQSYGRQNARESRLCTPSAKRPPPRRAVERSSVDQKEIDWDRALVDAEKVARRIARGNRAAKVRREDWQLAAKVAALSQRYGEAWLWDPLEALEHVQKPPRNRWGYCWCCWEQAAQEAGKRFRSDLRRIELPIPVAIHAAIVNEPKPRRRRDECEC